MGFVRCVLLCYSGLFPACLFVAFSPRIMQKIVLFALLFRLVFDAFLVNKICLFAMFCVVCLSVLPARFPK